VTGYVIHHASSTFWALIYEKTNVSESNVTTRQIAWEALKTAALLVAYTD
jgi:hypothetical protein